MPTLRLLRKPTAAAAALLCLVALSAANTTGASAGPLNENYDPPKYHPSERAVYAGTPGNPLVREWGVYQGLSEQAWMPYLNASPEQRELLDKIVQRPKATWFGKWQPDADIKGKVEKYIQLTTGGDPDVLVQTSIFRMVPWEREACKRLPTQAEQESYRRWIENFAAGVGDTHMAIIMQPDGPFVLCAPKHSKLPARMIRWAVKRLSAQPNVSVYIDGGAADWQRDDPKRALRMLIPMGVRWARGFALNSTHYDSTARQVKHAARISQALARRGITGKYAVINTSSNGRPFKGYTYKGPNFDNAYACQTAAQTRCVTLGIPPTVDVGNPSWGMSAKVNNLATRYVDAYLWFGRPWLYMQAAPFDLDRALTLARTTPY